MPLTAPLLSTFNPTYRLHAYTVVTKSFILQIFLKPSGLIDRNIWGKYIIVFYIRLESAIGLRGIYVNFIKLE